MTVVRKIACRVTRIQGHGEHVYTVDLSPASAAPRFKPGQFLHLALDPYEPGGFWPQSRVFSIASSPAQRDRLSITYAVKGAFTSRMERELTEGSDVWVKLPYGEFVVDPASDAVLFAGGTGVTAFTAFLDGLQADRGARVLLCYGARTDDLLIYSGLALACSQRVGGFECLMLAEDRSGRLDPELVWPTVEKLDSPTFYLSGPPAMLQALTSKLRARGVTANAIRTDAWE